MFAQPKLTICVPSRNRQRYFKETIRSLVANMRMDIEFVFADNSDDPSIMQDFMEDVLGDPRVRFVPTGERIYPMHENWERCVEAATGEYVCIIGDDDYIDPDVVDLIERTKRERSSVDVFVWSRLTYNWPTNRPTHCNVCVPMKTGVHEVKRAWLYNEFFTWKQHTSTPNCPFAIYHGAISKRIMDKIKTRFGGRYFEHPTVDFENSCKLLVTAESFFYSERPFSVLGSCPESNSASVGDLIELRRKYAVFMQELGRNMDDDAYAKDFPFPSILGVAVAVAHVQQWFKFTYGYKIKDWEKNFAEACAHNCGNSKNREHFDMNVEGHRAAFKKWHGGKFLKYFKPTFIEPEDVKYFYGYAKDSLFISENIADVQTPAELFHVVKQFIEPSENLTFKLLSEKQRAA